MADLFSYENFISLISLTALEVVLGIDNVIFISLLASGLPDKQSKIARVLGLFLALLLRFLMLLGISWLLTFNNKAIDIYGFKLSVSQGLFFLGGLFLIYKATTGVHDEITSYPDDDYDKGIVGKSMLAAIFQIAMVDIVFSLDSVITAIAMTNVMPVIFLAVFIAVIIMIFLSGYVNDFLKKYPTFKVLALSFIMLVGVILMAEALGVVIPKGYIYFAMGVSLVVEVINIRVRKKNNLRRR